MSIKFNDGSEMDADNYDRIIRLLHAKMQEGIAPTEIVSDDGVTLKVGNLKVNPKLKGKKKKGEKNVIRSKYKDWKIQVWEETNLELERSVFCCNYYRGETVQYFEVLRKHVRDENEVFKIAQECIDNR